MSTSASDRFAGLQSALLSQLEFFASRMLNKHSKRVMFLSSLYVQVTQLERMKADVVSKLNQVMGFTVIKREEAAHFPARISSFVWRGTSVGSMLSQELSGGQVDEERVQEVSAKVVDLCPRLIRYGSRTEMVHDVSKLISGVCGKTQTALAA